MYSSRRNSRGSKSIARSPRLAVRDKRSSSSGPTRNIDLLPREFRLLEYMMRRKDQLLTRAMLFEEVWNYKFVPHSNLVDVHMGRLRRKIDATGEQQMIQNVRGEG